MSSSPNNSLAFAPLGAEHFPFLLRWLTMPHVHEWRDSDIAWTSDLIAEKQALLS